MPRITIVLPVYNHARYVEHTLCSLYAQDYTDFQIVAVDDGSADQSLEILNRHHQRVSVIEARHQGPAAARNLALRATDSEFVAFMDADDLCAPERLRVQLERLESEKLDLVASAMNFIDAHGHPLPGIWTCPPHAANDYWAALLERNFIGTPSVMIRRHVLDAAGLFDERFTHAEDYDLWLRIGSRHAIGYMDSTLVCCRRHPANTSMRVDSHQHFERLALEKVDRRAARTAFNRLYSQERQRVEAWIWFLFRRGDSEFREEVLLALARHPQSQSLRFASGVFQCDCGEYEGAMDTFERLGGGDASAVHNLGVVHAQSGATGEAVSHFETALRLRPGYYDALYNLAALRNGEPLRLTRRPLREHAVPMVGNNRFD